MRCNSTKKIIQRIFLDNYGILFNQIMCETVAKDGNQMTVYREILAVDDFIMYGFYEYQNAVMFFYKSAELGCIRDCKPLLAKTINTNFANARLKRKELLTNQNVLEDVLRSGAEKARAIASETLSEVRQAIGINGDINRISAGF